MYVETYNTVSQKNQTNCNNAHSIFQHGDGWYRRRRHRRRDTANLQPHSRRTAQAHAPRRATANTVARRATGRAGPHTTPHTLYGPHVRHTHGALTHSHPPSARPRSHVPFLSLPLRPSVARAARVVGERALALLVMSARKGHRGALRDQQRCLLMSLPHVAASRRCLLTATSGLLTACAGACRWRRRLQGSRGS